MLQVKSYFTEVNFDLTYSCRLIYNSFVFYGQKTNVMEIRINLD